MSLMVITHERERDKEIVKFWNGSLPREAR